MVDLSFRVAHEPGTTPFVDTSAFLGTNPTGKPEVIPLRRESAPVHLILRLNTLGTREIRDEGSGAA
jgi:hypothetical protein